MVALAYLKYKYMDKYINIDIKLKKIATSTHQNITARRPHAGEQ